MANNLLHEGQWVLCQGPKRDYIGKIREVEENYLILERFVWAVYTDSVVDLIVKGWKKAKFDFQYADFCQDELKENIIYIPRSTYEIMPWYHGDPRNYETEKQT